MLRNGHLHIGHDEIEWALSLDSHKSQESKELQWTDTSSTEGRDDVDTRSSHDFSEPSESFSTLSPRQQQTGHILTWRNVNMKVKSKKAARSHVLKNLHGIILPGQLSAIMGHSGAGKTSLLNILAGKILPSRRISLQHDIQLDGEKVIPSAISVRRKIAFVAQRDVLMLTSTPHEAIRFSARLRLSREVSDEEVERLTRSILEELGLTRVADTSIGRLSGGEKRRTSLGIELVVSPSIVLLDEVTSGLDSYNAMQVLDVLKKVSLRGASVLFTLHQPNSQMFATIDHLVLMHRGKCMYQGSVDDLPTYFAQRGYQVPPNYNPADWILMVSEGMSSTEELENRGFFENFPNEENRRNFVETELVSMAAKKEKMSSAEKRMQSFDMKKRISMFREIRQLLKRGLLNILRDRKLLILRFSIVGVGAAIIGIAFYNVGSDSMDSVLDFQSHLGAVFFLCMAGIIVTQVVLLEFIDERPVIMREFSTNHYRMSSYIISRLILEGTSVLAQVLLFHVVTYFSLGLQGRFWYLLICFYTFAIVGASLAVCLGSFKNDPRDAKELIPMLMLPQLLFSGFFVDLEGIPSWLRWVNRIMPLTYTFRLVVKEEFSFCENKLGPEMVCVSYLNSQKATDEYTLQYWGILLGMIVLFRVMASFFLKRQMKVNASAT